MNFEKNKERGLKFLNPNFDPIFDSPNLRKYIPSLSPFICTPSSESSQTSSTPSSPSPNLHSPPRKSPSPRLPSPPRQSPSPRLPSPPRQSPSHRQSPSPRKSHSPSSNLSSLQSSPNLIRDQKSEKESLKLNDKLKVVIQKFMPMIADESIMFFSPNQKDNLCYLSLYAKFDRCIDALKKQLPHLRLIGRCLLYLKQHYYIMEHNIKKYDSSFFKLFINIEDLLFTLKHMYINFYLDTSSIHNIILIFYNEYYRLCIEWGEKIPPRYATPPLEPQTYIPKIYYFPNPNL